MRQFKISKESAGTVQARLQLGFASEENIKGAQAHGLQQSKLVIRVLLLVFPVNVFN